MMNIDSLWVERFRPATIDECILPESLKSQSKGMVASGNLTNLLLAGGPGTGKTTLAKAICNELGADWIMYNGSDGSLNIEELRNNISDFAHTTSINGNGQHKVIIIDEADGLSPLVQGALKHASEKYSGSCRFIFTANHKDKLIEPLQSRCAIIDYKFDKKELNGLIRAFGIRVVEILKSQQISYDVEAIRGVIMKFFPDNRRILNELQKYANLNGCIDDGILDELKSNSDELFEAILSKDFPKCKDWLVNNSLGSIFNMLYKDGENRIPKSQLPLWILKLGEFQKWHSTVPNQELNVLACLVEFMSEMG